MDKWKQNPNKKGIITRNRRSRSRSRSRDSETSSSRSRSSSASPPPKYKSERESRKEDTYSRYDHNRKRNINHERDKEDYADTKDYLEPPPPPRIADVSRETLAKVTPVQMKLATQSKQPSTKGMSVAAVFNNESSDDEIEQMPPECRMRMRNIGRDTPTSSGPNSFGKTKKGFCDSKKIFEKHLRDIYED